jgi:hypothetical protein
MRLEERLNKEIEKKMAELKATLTAKSRLKKKLEAVEKGGEDRAFWKEGFYTYRVANNVLRRTKKEVA